VPALKHSIDIVAAAITRSRPEIFLREITTAPPSESDVEELREMRTACGWYVKEIPKWLREVQAGTMLLFFIYLNPGKPVGMIALNLVSETDLSLASFHTAGRVEICSLFVYHEYRRIGVGAAAFTKLEDLARDMGAKVATVNTSAPSPLVKRYEKVGYRQYKEPKQLYSVEDLAKLGFTEEYTYAAYLEKSLTPLPV
jgi:GNAT superfamily N-acetyltransferase